MTLTDRLLSPWLSNDAGGLVIAALLVLLSGVAHALGAPVGLPWLLFALSVLLAAGAVRHLLHVRKVLRQYPAPGRLVDAGGLRLHLLAEGQAHSGRPTVVWFAGAHAGGMPMAFLHRALREHTRSILLDRAATGWSDVGPFPRTTAGEAEECWRALDSAGEAGPFILAGHSFGGLLVANMARRQPQRVHSVVLLDATPPDTIIFGPRLAKLKLMSRLAFASGIARLFGIHDTPWERAHREQPAYADVMKAVNATMGGDVQISRALDALARNHFASASIFRELTPEGMAACAWQTAVYEGDLDPLRVLLVAPGEAESDIGVLPEMQAAGESEAKRMQRFFPRTRERYMTTSSRAERVIAPAGTGHNFIYEQPQFVIDLIRGLLDR